MAIDREGIQLRVEEGYLVDADPKKLAKYQAAAKLSWRKRSLLKLLQTPIKFGNIPAGAKRNAFVRTEEERRIAAAFKFFDIAPETPAEAKWMMLALYLLRARFSGCRSLARQPGGARKNSPHSYAEIIAAFDAYCATARQGSQKVRAERFLKSRGGAIEIGQEKIRSVGGFLNMYRREKKAAS